MKNINDNFKRSEPRLREIRESSGLQQKQFAELFNVDPTTYNRYENGGIGKIPKKLIDAICEKFGINPAWLAGFENVEKYHSKDQSASIKRIPVYSSITPGTPIMSQTSFSYYEYIEEDKADFCFIQSIDVSARIHSGDILFLKNEVEITNGSLILVSLGSEIDLVRYHKYGTRTVLRPENYKKPELESTPQDKLSFDILGKVVAVKYLEV